MTARRAAHRHPVGARYSASTSCGVDMLRSKRGPVVMEVNSSPGLEGIENATGIDVAGEIIAFLETHARHGATETKGKG